jgi:F-type H+-transporting ATPase subunit epsilon
MSKMRVEVVSTEEVIFSGEAEFVVAPATEGEIGVYPQHVPLLTCIKPGVIRLKVPGSAEEVLVVVSGGIMEVQPTLITVLADTAIRGDDLDAARAYEAKRAAEDSLKHATDDLSVSNAHAALAAAIAELKALEFLKRRVH